MIFIRCLCEAVSCSVIDLISAISPHTAPEFVYCHSEVIAYLGAGAVGCRDGVFLRGMNTLLTLHFSNV
jgi:hypothetical protein